MKGRLFFAIVALVLAFGLAGSVALADPVNVGDSIVITQGGLGGHGNGGIFLLSWTSQDLSTSGSFYTFCLEMDELVSWGATYTVDSVGHDVVMGGTGTLDGLPLDPKIAWLYMQYRQETLTGWANENLSANGLQAAIWSLMGYDITGFSDAIKDKADEFIVLASTAPTSQLNQAMGVVSVINPVDGTTHRQSVLQAQIPEPLTLLLLGTGLIGLGVLGRYRF